jgi:hypothetical protein
MKHAEIFNRLKSYAAEIHWLPSEDDIKRMGREELVKYKSDTAEKLRKQEVPDSGLISMFYYYGERTKDIFHDIEIYQAGGDKIK